MNFILLKVNSIFSELGMANNVMNEVNQILRIIQLRRKTYRNVRQPIVIVDCKDQYFFTEVYEQLPVVEQ